MFALSILSSFKHYNANLKEQTAHILFDFALFIEIDSKANDLSFSTGHALIKARHTASYWSSGNHKDPI